MSRPIVGFIGLGAMGEPMAGHLLSAGFRVRSCANRSRDAIERLAAEGLEEREDAAAVGADADILMTIVFDEAQTDRVLRGDGGALGTLRPGSVVVVMSTVSPSYCRALREEAAERGVEVIDCPVSGLPAGAKAGTLSLMVGGDAGAIEKCRAALETMGTVMPCGGIGMGQIVKLGNNAMSIGTLGLLLEVRELVQGHGMDFDDFKAILNQSTGRSFVSESMPMPRRATISMAMPSKDLSICLAAAEECGASMPMVRCCYEHTLENE
ncbi:MAG: NAD(P)-dependent oxidoreductase [Myxococcota bacterium]|nr:NAD(P)-dependent oxidoreductase [Myxococcota bacterium]